MRRSEPTESATAAGGAEDGRGRRAGVGRRRPGRRPASPAARVFAAAVLAPLLTAGCASAPPGEPDAGRRPPERLEETLAAFRRLGFLAGQPEFPVVGRLVALGGPGDSTWVGFVASMPPAALGFSREGELFAASYQVNLRFLADGDTVRRVARREVVRVDDFGETARRDEAVFFQRFELLPAGRYDVEVEVRELTTRHEAAMRLTWRAPRFGAAGRQVSEPLLAHRVAPREALEQAPPLIASPRSTATATREPARIMVERYVPPGDPVEAEIAVEGVPLWRRALEWETSAAGPATAVVDVPVDRVPPGLATLRLRSSADEVLGEAPLLVALDDAWVYAEFRAAAQALVWAVSADTLGAWAGASPGERARRWRAFWRGTDPDPSTPANEFLERYFDRMGEAEERYDEPGIPGWRTDRGRAYVQLGPPEREVIRGIRRPGENPTIEWEYAEGEPLARELRLVFEDKGGFGIYDLTQRSEALLREAWREVRAAERPEAREEGDERGADGGPPGFGRGGCR